MDTLVNNKSPKHFLWITLVLLLVISCSKTKLVYYTPQMAKPVAMGEFITVAKPSNVKEQAALILQNKHHLNYTSSANATSKVLSKAAVNVFKKEVVNQVGEKVIKANFRLAKVSYNRFGRLYLGLGMIVLAALLILILASIPSLSGDIGCVLSLVPLMLAGIGLITAISGLIFGLLN